MSGNEMTKFYTHKEINKEKVKIRVLLVTATKKKVYKAKEE